MPRRPSLSKGPRLARPALSLKQIVPAAAAVKPTWLYELYPSQSLPTVDLTRTAASVLLSPDAYNRVLHFMRTKYRYVLVVNRSLSLAYYGMIFAHSPAIRGGIAISFLGALIPFWCMSGFLSLDIVRMLSRNYEFVFVSFINTVQWVCMAVIFADVRAVACFMSWLSVQTVIALDANFRTFPGATTSILISIPVMLAIGACCVFRLIQDANYFAVHVGNLLVSGADIIVFTSSTLAIFMAKKVYLKRTRQRQSELGQLQVPCVVLRARLHLRYVDASQNSRRHALSVRKADARSTSVEVINQEPHLQKLRLYKRSLDIVDVRKTILPMLGRKLAEPECCLSEVTIFSLYGVGSIGLLATISAWVLLLFSPNMCPGVTQVLGVTAAVCSFVYTTVFFAASQRNLVRSLLFNFDWVFTDAQLHALALSLCNMLQWRLSYCCAVLSCWLWFRWIIQLDALTPPIKKSLRFRKARAAPVVAVLLATASGIIIVILLEGSTHPLLINHILVRFPISGDRWYELHIASFALMRVATIVGWNMRLVLELIRHDEHELLFVRGSLEYSSPFETFPASSPTTTNAAVIHPITPISTSTSGRMLPSLAT